MKKISSFLLLFILMGCSSAFDEAVDSAEEAFNDGNYTEALAFYEEALEEQKDENTETIEDMIISLKLHEEIEQLVDAEKWDKAEKKIKDIQELSTPSPLAESVADLDKTIRDEQKQIAELEDKLEEIDKLTEDRKVKDADKLLKEVKEDKHYVTVKDDYKKSRDAIKTVKAEIEEEERRAEEERKAEEEKKQNLKNQREYFLQRFEEIPVEADKIAEQTGTSSSDMRISVHEQYSLWDDVLNEAYDIIIENISNPEELKEEQRQWVENVETEAEKLNHPDYGLLAPAEADFHRTDETIDRVKKLVDTYMQ